jgi:hypothetical protein
VADNRLSKLGVARTTVAELWRKLRGARRNRSFEMGPVLSISNVE